MTKALYKKISAKDTDLFCVEVKLRFGCSCVKEFRFHEKRKWRFDYAIPDMMIAVEVEGGAFTQGRHTRGKGFIADIEKYNTATSMGWRLFRTTPKEMAENKEHIFSYISKLTEK